MSGFKPKDRVRDLNHRWTPRLPEYGTVTQVDANGSVYVNWDGEGVHPIPSDPIALAHA